jgi:preprotein translocase subunit SecA
MGLFDRALNWGEGKQFKVFEQRVKLVGAYEAELELETDEELRARMDDLRERGHAGEPLEKLQAECFAVVREVGKRQGDRRDADGRGQDADGDPGRRPQLARREGRPRRHCQRLPGPA